MRCALTWIEETLGGVGGVGGGVGGVGGKKSNGFGVLVDGEGFFVYQPWREGSPPPCSFEERIGICLALPPPPSPTSPSLSSFSSFICCPPPSPFSPSPLLTSSHSKQKKRVKKEKEKDRKEREREEKKRKQQELDEGRWGGGRIGANDEEENIEEWMLHHLEQMKEKGGERERERVGEKGEGVLDMWETVYDNCRGEVKNEGEEEGDWEGGGGGLLRSSGGEMGYSFASFFSRLSSLFLTEEEKKIRKRERGWEEEEPEGEDKARNTDVYKRLEGLLGHFEGQGGWVQVPTPPLSTFPLPPSSSCSSPPPPPFQDFSIHHFPPSPLSPLPSPPLPSPPLIFLKFHGPGSTSRWSLSESSLSLLAEESSAGCSYASRVSEALSLEVSFLLFLFSFFFFFF